MEISAAMVRDLREKTGAGMMKCKEALIECKGNAEEAVDYLRKKGLASAEGKAGRTTSQGIIMGGIATDGRESVLLEVNCETDFVAKNDQFRNLTHSVLNVALKNNSLTTPEQLMQEKMDGQVIDEVRKVMVAKIGENITFSRLERLAVPQGNHGVFDVYLHGEEQKVGVVVQVECTSADGAKHDELKAFAHEMALQVCAMKPRFVSRKDVPEKVQQHEKEIILGQLKEDPKNSNKPEEIMLKIVEGRLDKFYKEFCLVEQVSIKDDTKTIQKMIEDLTTKLGGQVKVAAFRRWMVGENPAA
jgi:elongation factor Ts